MKSIPNYYGSMLIVLYIYISQLVALLQVTDAMS